MTYSKIPNFDSLWKDDLSCEPEVPNDWEKREEYKKFARKMYEKIEDYFEEHIELSYIRGLSDSIERVDN